MRISLTAAISAACFSMATAQAATLDFEGGPGYAPSDNQIVTPMTFNAFNIRILGVGAGAANPLSFEERGTDDGAPFFSFPPDENEGFVTDNPDGGGPRPYDTERDTTASLGKFFLRQTEAFAGVSPGDTLFRVEYLAAPSGVISGEIWDIDAGNASNSERWRVDVVGTSGSVLDSLESPPGETNDANSLDGKPWVFSFDLMNAIVFDEEVAHLDFVFTGAKMKNIGVAFDNFQTGTAVIPLPAALPMLVGALGFVSRRRKA